MKMLQTLVLVLIAVGTVSAQRSDIKGPKAKNLKSKDHPEVFAGKLVTAETQKVKGSERKNMKRSSAPVNQDTVAVVTRPRNEKGPKAKNRKAWQ